MDLFGLKKSSKTMKDWLLEYQCRLPSLSSQNQQSVPFYFSSASPVSSEVENSCSLEQISSPDDNIVDFFEPNCEIQQAVNKTEAPTNKLKTYNAINGHKATSASRRSSFVRTHYNYRIVGTTVPTTAEPLTEYEMEISVRFYRPSRATHRGLKVEHPVFAQEFICVGSNTLTELRDKVSCICNGKRFVDISDDPESPLPVLEANPAYFFIQDTFYNDNRSPNACNYSETVLKWASTSKGMENRQFKVKDMETTRLMDINVSLGTPLQYLHHGNCEHLFVISQIEVLAPHGKNVKKPTYPYLRSYNNFNRRTCYMCGLRSYDFIVEQSRRQFHDPSYLCRTCFYRFHYIDGKKVGEFKAYRIYDHANSVEDSNKNGDDLSDDNADSD